MRSPPQQGRRERLVRKLLSRLVCCGWLTVAGCGDRVANQRTGPAPRVEATPDQAIRFESYRNLVFLVVGVNDSKPLSFVLDTGSGDCIIDRAHAANLGLTIEKGGKGIGSGNGTFDFALTKDVAFRLGTWQVPVTAAKVVDLSHLAMIFGRPVDGVLGYEVFARFVVVIDHDNHTVRLFDPKSYHYAGRGQEVPIQVDLNVPWVTAKLKVAGQINVDRKYLIDTGWTGNVSDDWIGMTTSRKLETITGAGLGKERKGYAARVERLEFAGIAIENCIGQTGKPLIGGGILCRFNIVLDYGRQVMILEPNRRSKEPFRADASGIMLRRTVDLKHFQVHHVAADSPAAEAGLERGDQITMVDGQPAVQLDLTELKSKFTQDGKQHQISVQRGDKKWQVTLTLRELL